MRLPTRCILLVCLLAWGSCAMAMPTGEDLLEACSATVKQQDGGHLSDAELARSFWCVTYLSGFLDAVGLTSSMYGKPAICLPANGISNDQLARIVTKWLRDNPEHLHESGRMETMIALAKAFPCQ